jgi:hypothetical protein
MGFGWKAVALLGLSVIVKGEGRWNGTTTTTSPTNCNPDEECCPVTVTATSFVTVVSHVTITDK